MLVNFYKAPKVDAGIDQSICANNLNINLKGTSTTNAGTWLGGHGTFSPDTISLNVSYLPTAAEVSAGSVTLTLKSRNNIGCLPVTDDVKITFTPQPAIALAHTQNSCANKSAVALTATVTNASGGIWSNGGGTFSSSPATLTNTYSPSTSEIQKGKAVIKFTTTGNGTCNPVTDSVIITIAPAPIVNAGADQVVCGDVTSVNLTATITNATGGTWTKAVPATGSFANANAISTTYTPSASDLDSGYVKLNFTSTGIGTCQAVNDTVRIFFTVVPTINAGPDQTVCTNDFPVKLNAFGSPGSWSGGAGTYAPSATALNATYTPTAAEISSGTLNLTFTTTPSATCSSKKDAVKITIKPSPIVNAGGEVSSCSNSAGIPLNGTVTNATGGKWSTLGTGTFTPNTTTLNAQYVPSANDINIENFKLVLTSTGNGFCPAVTDTLTVDLQAAPIVNAGPDQSYCANNATIQLNGVMQSISGLGGIWTGGAGTFTPNNKATNAKYKPTAGEIASGTLTLTFSSISNGICPVKSDDVTFTFTPAPTTNAGSDKAICENAVPVSLSATSTLATSGVWTSLGGGSFAPSNIGNTTSYFPAGSDITNGSVDIVFETSNNANCLSVKDTVHIDFNLLPVVDAGKDTTLCKDLASYKLQGTASHTASLQWTTSGTGTFDNNALANATYTPSTADKTGGSITLTLTAGGNGTCSNKTDKMVIKFAPVPVVTAGSNRSICADVNDVAILGKITNAGGGKWTTSGTGTFLNPDSLQTTYSLSTADKIAGAVTLTLTSTLNGVCSPAVSSFTIKIDPVPTVNIGPDRTICADSNGINLTAVTTNATAVKWASSGSGSFSPNVNSATPLYIPSATDRTNGKVTLWATTSGSGSCNATADTLNLTINPAPLANAGTDLSICKDHTSIPLTGTITNAGGGLWTTSGTGTFNPDNTSLSTAYIPSANDKTSGTVILTLKSTGNGLCKSTGSQVTVTFTPTPTVNAGADKTFCSIVQSISLSGSVKFGTTASTGQWTALGGGSILPDSKTLTATYYPTSTEVTNGKATLVLTSTTNGNCAAVNDTVQYFFQKLPVVIAGPNDTVCADMNTVAITATGINAKSYSWSTLGNGSFSPSNLSLNTNYIPTAADVSAGKVDVIITTLNNGVCPASKDTLSIIINPKPTINVGPDMTVCTNLENINLVAAITNAKGVKWSSSGSGHFSPTDSTLTPGYYFSSVDISLGNIVLTAVTTGNGLCKAVYADQVIIAFAPAPVVNAGPDITTCAGNGAIQLNGTITNSTAGGTWVTDGSGTFSNANALNATYTPSSADETSGPITITLVSNPTSNCQSFTDDFDITFNTAPVINAGPDSTYCTNSLPIQLQGSGASGTWSGGAGTFTPDNTTLNASYMPTAAEIASGTLTLTLKTNPGLCVQTSDNVTFKIKTGPTAIAGSNDAMCANTPGGYQLTGSSNTSSAWTTPNGEGTFLPNASAPNAHFIPSASQIANGSVTLILSSTGNAFGCPSQSTDQLVLNITPAPTVNAGFDITTCTDVTSITLSGTKSAASTGVQWTTSSGNGSFSPQAVSTTFTPAAADKTAGKVSVYLTTTGSGQCAEAKDTLEVIFTPAPTVNAGSDATICASNAKAINLKGTVTIASGGIWSSAGSGTFAPDETALQAAYFPTNAEISAGSVSLTLTTTGNGECLPKSAPVKFTIQTPDTVNAGKDLVICSDNASIPLSGASSTGVKWSTNGSGSFTPDNQVNTNYQPSTADKANGGITITLTTTNVNSCPQVADYLTVKFNPTPILIVNSGFDKTVCITDQSTQLNGFVLNAKGGKWTTSGNGTFTPSDTTLDAFYVFGSADKTGPTTITLTATGTGPCSPVSDNMKITYQAIPTVKVAQKNIPACADVDSINISATVVTATSGRWTTSGTGYFAPKADSLATSYFPSKSDASLGAIWLTVMSVNNGECGAAQDTVFVNFGPSPTIDAGPDKNICRNATSIALAATTTVATGGAWTTSGAGTISPNNALTTSYQIAAADSVNDAVTMTVTSTGQGTCKPVTDQVTYTFDNAPVVNAGPDVIVCETSTSITLAGTVKNTNVFAWQTSGSGTFVPDNKTLSAVYVPSSNDIQNASVTLSLVTDKTNACTPVSDQMTITLQKQATVVLTTDPACYSTKGIAVSATVNNATGGTWSTSGGGNFSPNNSTATGKYFFGFTDATNQITLSFITNPTVCPAVSASQVLTVNLPPSANAGKDEFVCQGNNITLSTNATNNFQYQWTDISNSTVVGTASFVTVNIPNTKSYQLQVTDQNSCTGVDTVTVNSEKPVTFGLAASICLDPYFSINALPSAHNANGSFQWYKDGNLMQDQQDTSIYASEAGKYVITYNIGQCTSKDSTQVHPLPIMVNKGKTACIGAIAGIKTTNIPDGSYTWTPPITQVNSYMNNVNPVVADTNFYYVTGKDVYSCQTTDSIRVIGVPKPILALNDVNVCGDTITLDATPSNLNKYTGFTVAYNWTKDNVNQNISTGKYFIKAKGQYIANVAIMDCKASDTANVTFNPVPSVNLADTAVFCSGSEKQIRLDAGYGTSLSDTTGIKYLWSTNATTRVITVTAANKYYVTITTQGNCKASDSINVIGVQKPILALKDANLCIGDTLTLKATPTNISAFKGLPVTYNWSKDDVNQNKHTSTYFTNQSGKYIAVVNIQECQASDTANLKYNPLPVISLADTTVFCPKKQRVVVLNAGYGSTNTADSLTMKYLWSNGDTTRVIKVSDRGEYTVTITNSNKCKANDGIFVKDLCAPQIYIPNAFTPGKGGKDNVFMVQGMYFKNFKITIYSRWGEVLFSSNSKEVSWNGEYINQEMQYGVYPYIITYDAEDPQYPSEKVEGSITLLR